MTFDPFTNTTPALTWFQLSAQANPGDRVRFVTAHDIFPHARIEAGEMATVTVNYLNELQPVLYLMPDNQDTRTALAEWGGQIYLPGAGLDDKLSEFGDHPIENPESPWHTESPIMISDKLSERQIVGGHQLDGTDDMFEATLKTFLIDNADGFTPEEIADIAQALAAKQTYVGGGGATPVFQISLVHDLGRGWEAYTSRTEAGNLELYLRHKDSGVKIDLEADSVTRLREILNAS